jgi:hypothetical protein
VLPVVLTAANKTVTLLLLTSDYEHGISILSYLMFLYDQLEIILNFYQDLLRFFVKFTMINVMKNIKYEEQTLLSQNAHFLEYVQYSTRHPTSYLISSGGLIIILGLSFLIHHSCFFYLK